VNDEPPRHRTNVSNRQHVVSVKAAAALIADGGRRVKVAADASRFADASTGSGMLSPSSVP
jgi:hypothetical protein